MQKVNPFQAFGVGIALALASFGCASTSDAPGLVTGTVSGTVTFEGEAPKAEPRSGNGASRPDRSLLVDSGSGIANVVITLTVEGAEGEPPSEPVAVDMKGSQFESRITVVQVGATVSYRNSDDICHNLHTFALKNEGVNRTVAAGDKFDQKLENAEVVLLACDLHPWMQGYVFVTDATHWATTSSDGRFSIPGVPPGTYKLALWHETLGKAKDTVTINADGRSEIVDAKMKVGARRPR